MEPVVIMILFWGILFVLIVGSVMCERKVSRIIFGIAALACSGLMFLIARTVESSDLNVWYSASARVLLDESVKALESGRQADVVKALKQMKGELEVTYENRGNFSELANKVSSELAQKQKNAEKIADDKTPENPQAPH